MGMDSDLLRRTHLKCHGSRQFVAGYQHVHFDAAELD
jgi:hypothetical protein